MIFIISIGILVAILEVGYDYRKNSKFLKRRLDDLNVLRQCWISLLVFLFGYYAMNVNDQGVDAFSGLTFGKGKYTLMIIIIFSWAYVTWYSGYFAVSLTKFTPFDRQYNTRAQFYIPVYLGCLPFISFFMAFWKYTKPLDPYDILFFIPLAFYFAVIYSRKDEYLGLKRTDSSKNNFYQWFAITPVRNQSINFRELKRFEKFKLVAPFIFYLFMMIGLLIYPVQIAWFFDPFGIILSGFVVWIAFLNIIIYLEKKYRIPAFLLLLIWIFICSNVNNNHDVRTLPVANKQKEIHKYFKEWYDIHTNKDSIVTVILVAGEGGGIRAAYWTGRILAFLHDTFPNFNKSLFAFSTASGSSLGAAAYNALIKYHIEVEDPDSVRISKEIKNFLSKDYLSPVAAGMIYTDMTQKIIPWPIRSFDRAYILEKSWEIGWQNTNKTFSSPRKKKFNPFENAFNSLWEGNGNYNIPSMFLNSTLVEEGRLAINSNLTIDSTWGAVDVGKKLHNQISLSTATLLSARFPVLTPPGRIKDSNEVNHLADGGYYDNSAIITMLNIYKEIKPITKGDNIKFLLIFIRNSRNEPPSSLSSLYEEKTPLYAFYNSWSNKVNQETSGADHLINFFLHLSDSTKSGDRFISIQLPRYQNDNIPLGWFLSDSAATTIDKCLDSLKLGILKNDSTIEVISDYLKK